MAELDGGALDALVQLVGGDRGAAASLVAGFLQSADELVEEASAALDDGRTEVAVRAAHRLVGSCPMYGAAPLAKLAAAIERDPTPARAHELREAWRATRSALEEWQSTPVP